MTWLSHYVSGCAALQDSRAPPACPDSGAEKEPHSQSLLLKKRLKPVCRLSHIRAPRLLVTRLGEHPAGKPSMSSPIIGTQAENPFNARARCCTYILQPYTWEMRSPISSERFWPMRKMAVQPSRQPIMTEPRASYMASPVTCVIQVDTPAEMRHRNADSVNFKPYVAHTPTHLQRSMCAVCLSSIGAWLTDAFAQTTTLHAQACHEERCLSPDMQLSAASHAAAKTCLHSSVSLQAAAVSLHFPVWVPQDTQRLLAPEE